jgi:hypothetical protein
LANATWIRFFLIAEKSGAWWGGEPVLAVESEVEASHSKEFSG